MPWPSQGCACLCDAKATLQVLLPEIHRREDRTFLEKAQTGMKEWRKLMQSSKCCRFATRQVALLQLRLRERIGMSTVQTEITALEERLRMAELGPDPKFFEDALADDAVLVSQDGEPSLAKSRVVEAHQSGKGPKFTRVEMSDMKIFDHGTAAVVTCQGLYEGPQSSVTLKFMRVWVKKSNGWQIVAGSVSN